MADFTSEMAEHLPRLRRYARSLLHDRVRADDLVQDTMMRALEKAHLYQHDTNLRGWLVTIMHNEHVNSVRRSMRGAVLVSDEELGELGHSATQEAPIELQEIRGAVQRLPQDQREAIQMAFFEGKTHREIAEALHEPLGTVKARIRRGMLKLRDSLREYA